MQLKKFTSGTVRAFDREAVEKTRTIQFIISSSTKDRHRSIVNMKNWQLDNFNKNPIVGYQHDVYGGNMCTPNDPDDVIGEGRAWIETVDGEELLIGEVKFEPAEINAKAEKIFRKVLNGSLRATSVGFLEVGAGELRVTKDPNTGQIIDETYFFAGQELLEFSIVNIPSNPDAVGRSLSVQADWALMYIQRFLPDTMSLADIRNMKVGDVMEIVQKGVKIEVEKAEEEQKKDLRSLYECRLLRSEADLRYINK